MRIEFINGRRLREGLFLIIYQPSGNIPVEVIGEYIEEVLNGQLCKSKSGQLTVSMLDTMGKFAEASCLVATKTLHR